MAWGLGVARPCQLARRKGERVRTTAPKQSQDRATLQGLWIFRSEGTDSTVLISRTQDRMSP